MTPSCALLGGFAIGARVALLWQHYGNAWRVLALCLVFSGRVHVRYMLSPVRLSSLCLSVRSCALLRRLKFSAIFLRH